MTKINKKNAGFSLIELLFAMLFLSVIVFGVIKLQTSNLTLSHTKQLELKGQFIASQGLEIADGLGYTELESNYNDHCTAPNACECELDGTLPYTFDCEGTAETIMNGVEYSRTFTLEPEPGGEALNNAFLVTCTVTWTDSGGEHTVEAKKLIF